MTTWLAEGRNPVHVKEAMGHADLAKEHLRPLVKQDTDREQLRDLA